MRPEQYTCPGCRQCFVVGPPAEGDVVFNCPLVECGRPVWHRFSAPDDSGRTRLTFGTDDIPDLDAAAYVVDRSTLLLAGVPVITGPPAAMRHFADILNVRLPDMLSLADVVRELVQTSGFPGAYCPGCLLVRAGSMALAHSRRIFEDEHPNIT